MVRFLSLQPLHFVAAKATFHTRSQRRGPAAFRRQLPAPRCLTADSISASRAGSCLGMVHAIANDAKGACHQLHSAQTHSDAVPQTLNYDVPCALRAGGPCCGCWCDGKVEERTEKVAELVAVNGQAVPLLLFLLFLTPSSRLPNPSVPLSPPQPLRLWLSRLVVLGAALPT